jgi:uncharacterized protein YndB with AHSA1/START domain
MAEFATSIDIDAPAEVVFDFLVTTEGMLAWMGEYAELDPAPGGTFAINVAGFPIRGEYVEVRRPERVVVSWGHLGNEHFPPGGSLVAFTLVAIPGGTRVELVHSGLPETRVAGHQNGWEHFMPRLRAAATGRVQDDDDWAPLSTGERWP